MTSLPARTLSRATTPAARRVAARAAGVLPRSQRRRRRLRAGQPRVARAPRRREAGRSASPSTTMPACSTGIAGVRRVQRRGRAIHLAAVRHARSARCRPGRVGAGRPSAPAASTARRTSRRATPLGAGPFTAIPLRGDRQDGGEALGLLLLRPWTGSTADISWLATVLGQKVEQIRGRGSLTEDSASCGASARCSSPSSTPSPTRFC